VLTDVALALERARQVVAGGAIVTRLCDAFVDIVFTKGALVPWQTFTLETAWLTIAQEPPLEHSTEAQST